MCDERGQHHRAPLCRLDAFSAARRVLGSALDTLAR